MVGEPSPLISLDDEIEGDHRGTADFAFRRIGESVPLKPNDHRFDLENPPSQPLAVSERLGLLFLAHSEGFLVARTKDVIRIAKEIKEKGKGPCVQGSSVADVMIGRVSILSLSRDSSTLAATVGGDIHFFSVDSLLSKEHEPSLSCSIGEAGVVKDFKWRKNDEKSFVVLSSDSSLYCGYSDAEHLKDVMDNVDAVDWSVDGDFIAVAKKSTLSIMSSSFKDKFHMSLLFKSWPTDNDSECTTKVDSINWVRDDSIVVGCIRVDEDGNEDGYLVQVITSRDNGFTMSSCTPLIYSFPDLFGGIVDDILPAGKGPNLLLSYLGHWDILLASNKKAIDDHILMLGWLRNDNMREVVSLDFQTEMFPRIDLQENRDDNLVLGLAVDKVSLFEKVTLQIGSDVEERSPYCIFLCLTCEGKLIMFHAVRISDRSDLPTPSAPLDDCNSVQEKTSICIPLGNDSSNTTSGLKGVESGFIQAKSSQITVGMPNSYTGKEQNKVWGGNTPGMKEQDTDGSTGKIASVNQIPTELPNIQSPGSIIRNNSKAGIQESPLSSSGMGSATPTLSMGNMSIGASTSLQTSTDRIVRSGEMGKGLVGTTYTAGSSFGSQSTGKFLSGNGSNMKPSTLPFSASISSASKEMPVIDKGQVLSFSPNKTSSGDLFGGRSYTLKDSIKESMPQSFVSSSNKTSLNEGQATSLFSPRTTESAPIIRSSLGLTHKGSQSEKSFVSITHSLTNNSRASNLPQASDSKAEASEEFYNVKDMVKELDILLSSIEKEGGFKDACTVFQKKSLLAVEEGVENIVEISRRCKNKVEEQLVDIQRLQTMMLQVSSRQVYTEGIVKQASNTQYWDMWNRQKLSPEFDLKRQNILTAKQNLTSHLIELERHFNSLEINKFGETGRGPTGRRAFHNILGPSRHTHSLHSVYNTLNSQLATAQQLSECLSNQMAVLSLNKPSVKRQTVAKELFESIGLDHEDSSFLSPDVKRPDLTPDFSKRVSPLTSNDLNEYQRRSKLNALQVAEPETARRRRDSLNMSLPSFEPKKTTVKRVLLEDRFSASVGKSSRKTEAVDLQMAAFTVAKPKSIQGKPFKQASEPQPKHLFKWAKGSSDLAQSLVSRSQPMNALPESTTRPAAPLVPSNNMSEVSSLPEPSIGSTLLGIQPRSSTERSTIPKTVSNIQFEAYTANQTSLKTSSIVSLSPWTTTVADNNQGSKHLNSRDKEDSPVWSLPRSSEQSTVSPENLSNISKISNISSLSSASGVQSGTKNWSTSKVEEIQSDNESSENLSTLPKPLVSTTSFLPASSASTSSTICTSVTPSLPPTSFSSFSVRRSSLDDKHIGETKETASALPSRASTSAAFSQPIFSSSILASSEIEKAPTMTASLLPSNGAVPQAAPHLTDKISPTKPITEQAPSTEDSIHHREVNSKLAPATSKGQSNEDTDGLSSEPEPRLFPPSSQPKMPSVMSPPLTITGREKDEVIDINLSQEDEMEEEAPVTTPLLNFRDLGGFGLGSTPPSSAQIPNPFGGSFLTANTAPATASSVFGQTPSPGEHFRPATFNLPSAHPVVQQPPPVNSNVGFSGFGQPNKIGVGQQALGSVLGSFGQSRQLGAGGPGFGLAPSGGFASAATGGGFTSLPSAPVGGFSGSAIGGGFAGGGGAFAGTATGGGFAAVGSGGGGFAAAASAGGGFAAAASAGSIGFGGAVGGVKPGAGFGSFGSNQGGGFSAFGNNSASAAGKPPANLLTQMRK